MAVFHGWKLVEQFFERRGLITASGSHADHPATNAGNDLRSSYWRANASGAQTLTIDTQSTLTICNVLCLARTNANAALWTDVLLEVSDDDTAYSDVANPILPKILFPGSSGFEAGGDDAGNSNTADYYYYFGNTLGRYWRLSIGGSSTAPEVGVMTIGKAFETDFKVV